MSGPKHELSGADLTPDYTHRQLYLASLTPLAVLLLPPPHTLLHCGEQAGHLGGHGGLLGGVVVQDLTILNSSIINLILGSLLTLGRFSFTTNTKYLVSMKIISH